MKKTVLILLSLLLVVFCAAFFACEPTSETEVTNIEIDASTLPDEIKYGGEVDYAEIKVVVTFSDGSSEEMTLDDARLTVEKIDTTVSGSQTLKVTYSGKSAQATLTVAERNIDDYDVVSFDNTSGYSSYLLSKNSDGSGDSDFADTSALYIVGIDNGYVCVPVTKVDYITSLVTNTNVKTTYKLYLKSSGDFTELSEAEEKTYLSKVENNVYYFTENAVGNTFRLEISLDESYSAPYLDESEKTIEQTFVVVNGYNVYNAKGLSVLDNLNTNSWSDIKNSEPFEWDNGKKLNEFTNVERVILHNDINITKDDLPANYFWTKDEEARGDSGKGWSWAYSATNEVLKDLLEGSLKETYLGEDWEGGQHKNQRGLYVSNGIGLSGNYLKLSYTTGLVYDNDGTPTAENGGIYIVCDMNASTPKEYPESHYSLISYQQYNEESANGNSVIENVYLTGNCPKSENDEIPAGLMTFSGGMASVNVTNCVASQWFSNITVDKNNVVLNVSKCKFYDSFSQMIYGWYAGEFNISECRFERAGGPLFILEVADKDDSSRDATVLNIDSASVMYNPLSGEEEWFKINNLPSSTLEAIFSVAQISETLLGRSLHTTTKINDSDVEMYNVIAVIIPEPSEVFTNTDAIIGELNITAADSVTKYGMDDAIFYEFVNMSSIASNGATLCGDLKTNFSALLSEDQITAIETLKAGFEQIQTSTTSTAIAPVYKCGECYCYFNGTGVGNILSSDLVSGVKQLYDGTATIIATLNAMKTQMEAAGQTDYVAVIDALLPQWTALSESLQPIAEKTALSDEEFAAAWAAATGSYLGLWINPGGLDASNPNLTIKHFEVLFGIYDSEE